ncbi:MAG: ribonuclease R family protein, partial [Roseimicrobium sp.]
METKILKLLGRADYVPSNVPQLIEGLGLHASQQQELQEVLHTLETDGKILRTKGNRYILSQPADMVAGIIQINRAGKGFLLPDEPGAKEIVIQEASTGTALNGDRVLVRRDVKPQGLRPKTAAEEEDVTGTVVRILERKRSRLVGTLKQAREFLYVVPDDPRIPHHISVPPARDTGRPAHVGDKVVVELTLWESRATPPEGEIVEVLGPPDAEGVDMLSVLLNYGLPLSFPKEVLNEANAIVQGRANNEPSEEDFVGRLDCRDHMVITIDPDDAKDFDDAICLHRESKDHWKLWVHIADVSHYVKSGSELDKEAYERGNSTYLVDRVIPMLPEALSNELCSLKPNVARLTKCVEFDLATDGTVVKAAFHSAVIRSQRRYTYQEAFQIIQREPQDDLERMVQAAHQMAQRIRAKRFRSGALDLEFPENKIRLDDRGKILRIERIENDVSHQLIEEYMLLANEAVAGRLMGLARPSVFRVHEKPKAKRLEAFQDDVLGHRVPCGDLTKREEVQKLLRSLEKLSIGPALKIGFLRSLMRARYGVEPLGHYGLNKTKYTHFTSPIRRYADLVVHRTLFNNVLIPVPELKKTAEHISNTERTSSDAERDSKDVK